MTRNRPKSSPSNGASSDQSRSRDAQNQPRFVDASDELDESNDDLFDDPMDDDDDWGEAEEESPQRSAVDVAVDAIAEDAVTEDAVTENTTANVMVTDMATERMDNVVDVDVDEFEEVMDEVDTSITADTADLEVDLVETTEITDAIAPESVAEPAESTGEEIASEVVTAIAPDGSEVLTASAGSGDSGVLAVDIGDEAVAVEVPEVPEVPEATVAKQTESAESAESTTFDSLEDLDTGDSREAPLVVPPIVREVEVREVEVREVEVREVEAQKVEDREVQVREVEDQEVEDQEVESAGSALKVETKEPIKASEPPQKSKKSKASKPPKQSTQVGQSGQLETSEMAPQSTLAILKALFVTIGKVLLTLLASIQQIWQALLPLIRKILPNSLGRRMSDTGITIIAILFLAGVFWINSLLPKQTAIARYEPAPMVRDSNERAIPALPRAPRFKSLSPEELTEVEIQVEQVADNYAEGLVQSVEDDLPRHLLTVQLGPDWYVLSEREQNRLTGSLLKLLPSLKFDHLAVLDDAGELVARNPVVGKMPLIYKRTPPLSPSEPVETMPSIEAS